ncbi:MAG: hypothetical protein JWN70_5408, partial [Planctomycetaceae bacterium]|nr:hypothetical protein [Planctomycetaceae bacterium]
MLRPSGTCSLACLLSLLVFTDSSIHASDLVLDQTTALTEERPLDEVIVDGLNRFC